MLTAIRNWVIRTMMKSKGQTGVVQSLPKRDIVEINTQITAQKLMQAGIDPDSLKNADQVENAIIAIESRPKVQEGIKSTKSAKIMDMEGKEIPPGAKIMGGKQAETEAEIAERLSRENKEATRNLQIKLSKDKGYQKFKGETEEEIRKRFNLDDPEDMAQGGRAGFKTGLGKRFLELLKGEPKKMFRSKDDVPTSVFSEKKGPITIEDMANIPEDQLRKIRRTQELGLYTETPEILKAGNLFERFTKKVGGKRVIDYDRAEIILNRKLRGDETLNELLQIEYQTRPGRAEGGRIGYANGTPSFEDYLKERGMIEKRQRLEQLMKEFQEDMRRKKVMEQKQEAKDGGRIGLKDGMDRRTFLKIMGGLASIPILGKFFKGTKVASKAAPVAKTVSKSTPPPYFFELAETIKKFGKPDKVTYSDRVEIHRMVSKDGKSELQLTEDLSTGSMQIKKIKPEEDMVNEDIVLEYRKGDVDVDPEAGTAFKEADEYTEGKEVTQRIYKDDYNEPDFYEGEGIQEIIEEIKEAPSIKKAGGGIARMLGE